jgi:hypothetical protein
MRTTIRLDDALLIEAKKKAAESHRTLTAVIEDALRESFSRKGRPAKRRRVRLPTAGGGGLLPGVDLDNTAALLDRMDGLDGSS